MMGFGNLDLKAMAKMDPNLLKAAGIDPKLVSGMDKAPPSAPSSNAAAAIPSSSIPSSISTSTAALAAGMGLDPKLMASLDPKLMSAMMDPALLASMSQDPKTMQALFGGMDPRLFGFDPKMFDPKANSTKSTTSTSAAAAAAAAAASAVPGLDPRLLGLDPKMLQGLDSKALQSLGIYFLSKIIF